MAVWAYKGIDARGKTVTGARDADSPKMLRAIMRREGIIVTDVAKAQAGKAAVAGQGTGLKREVHLGDFARVKRTDVAAFTRQLSTLLKAGIPLAECLGALFDQIENPKFKTIVGDVRTRVNEGSSLADAMGRHRAAFEDVYVSMVRAGETAGNLDEVLLRLAEFMEAQAGLRSKVISALMYPAIMLVVGVVIMGFTMVVVVPQVTQLFDDAEQTLPWNTQLLIFVADVIGNYWYVVLLVVGLSVWGFMAWKRSPKGRESWDRIKLRAPLFGNLTRQIAVARFTRALGTMLRAGVPLLRAFDICKDLLGNVVLQKVVEGAREEIQQGASIAVTLRKSKQFPSLVTHMIAVGERAGELEQMLHNIADAYESEVEMKLDRLTSMLTPIMILVMGGGVMFVVFSILSPIMQMSSFF